MNDRCKQGPRFTSTPQSAYVNRYITSAVLALAWGTCSTVGVSQASAATTAQPQGVCDIYAAGGNDTICVAAHSTTRALYAAYNGLLYQVTRASDNQTRDIGLLSPGGYVDASQQDAFCANTTCYISKIYDQSSNHNDLKVATGSIPGPASNGFDNPAVATAAPITIAGHKAYGVYIAPGMGYRNNRTTGVAKGDAAEGMYAVLDGLHYNDGACCFDYGNAESNGAAGRNGTMEAITFHNGKTWGWGDGNGPWLLADMENGMYSGVNQNYNAGDPSIISVRFLTATLRGKTNFWSLQGGDAQGGNAPGKYPPGASLAKLYEGVRPNPSKYHPEPYSPMRKEGAIILGTGGDNSTWSAGTFYEGAMTAKSPTSTSTDPTSGYPSDATNAAVQANIVQAGYKAINPWSAAGAAINAGGPASGNFAEDVGFTGGTGYTDNQATGTSDDNYARPKVPNKIDTDGFGAFAPMEVYRFCRNKDAGRRMAEK